MENSINLIFAGVGGQGILLASDIAALAAMYSEYDIKKSEIHGMSQRGGSVFSHLRLGEKIYSPIVSLGAADFLISFERLETLRWKKYTNPNTKVIILDKVIKPSILSEYPPSIKESIKKQFRNNLFIDPGKLIKIIGNEKFLNLALLGVLASLLDIETKHWKKAISKRLPTQFYDANYFAFKIGQQLFQSEISKTESFLTI